MSICGAGGCGGWVVLAAVSFGGRGSTGGSGYGNSMQLYAIVYNFAVGKQ